MNSLKSLLILALSLPFFSLLVGCEKGDDDPAPVVTNIVYVSDSGEEVQTNIVTVTQGGGNVTPPPSTPTHDVIVANDSLSITVQVSFNGGGSVGIAPSGSQSWTYTVGSSFDITIDGAPRHVTDNKNHLYTVYDSLSTPGTLEVRGNAY